MKSRTIILAPVVVIVVYLLFAFDIGHYLTLEFVTEKKNTLQNLVEIYPIISAFTFLLIYVGVTALSIPGALILTLLGGALFGLTLGVTLALTGATCGATLAFLGARYFARTWIEQQFPRQIRVINTGIEKEGWIYLLALRLLPIFPFFLVNLLMGVTRLKTFTFFFVSAIGMLPATTVFVNTGTELSKIQSLGDITSPRLLFSLMLLGLLPIVTKLIFNGWKKRMQLKRYPKPKVFDRNLIVIGAGAGGLVSSYIAATVKAKVTLIEKHKMGGDCLNTGCVPSKAFIKVAKMASDARKAASLGVHCNDLTIDFAAVMEHVRSAITLVQPHDSVERYTKLGVECIKGQAFIKSPYAVEVNGEILTTRGIIVATGASPFVPNFDGLSSTNYYTSDTIWDIPSLPEKLLIVGAGPIACELAQSFCRLGTQVIMVGRSSRVMMKEDEDVSHAVMSTLCQDGVDIRLGHRVLGFSRANGKGVVHCEASEGKSEILFDEVIMALGRKAHTQGFGLEGLGVVLNENGTIKVDDYLRSSIPTIFACGDVAGPFQFTHMASHQAWFACVNALFGWIKQFKVDYSVVPWVTYVDPEVARLGLNEIDAIKQKIPYEATVFHLNELDRAITDRCSQGFIKVLTRPGKDRILGVTIVGSHAGEFLPEFVLAMKKNIGLNTILGTIHAYPTMAEANKYVAGEWKRKHVSPRLIKLVEGCLKWRRGKQ